VPLPLRRRLLVEVEIVKLLNYLLHTVYLLYYLHAAPLAHPQPLLGTHLELRRPCFVHPVPSAFAPSLGGLHCIP
jgi:hypothetical protein